MNFANGAARLISIVGASLNTRNTGPASLVCSDALFPPARPPLRPPKVQPLRPRQMSGRELHSSLEMWKFFRRLDVILSNCFNTPCRHFRSAHRARIFSLPAWPPCKCDRHYLLAPAKPAGRHRVRPGVNGGRAKHAPLAKVCKFATNIKIKSTRKLIGALARQILLPLLLLRPRGIDCAPSLAVSPPGTRGPCIKSTAPAARGPRCRWGRAPQSAGQSGP